MTRGFSGRHELVVAVDTAVRDGEKTDGILRAIDSAAGDKSVARALRSLYAYRFSTESPIDQVAADVTNVMVSSADEKLCLPTEEAQDFRERLQTLLSIDSLWQALKAGLLAKEHANAFVYSKVVTDIRPIFGDDVSEVPSGAILTHNLHIHYATMAGEHRDFVVAMASEDLRDLKESLERADKKVESLTHLLKAVDVQQIDVKENE